MSKRKTPPFSLPADGLPVPEPFEPEAGTVPVSKPDRVKKTGQVKPALKSRIDSLFLDIREEVVESDETPQQPQPAPASTGPKTRPLPGARLPAAQTWPVRPDVQPVYPAEHSPEAPIIENLTAAPLTDAGLESLQRRSPVYRDASAPGLRNQPGNEAVMAVPFWVHGEDHPVDGLPQTLINELDLGLLEVIDNQDGRLWSEDEKRLVEQVADQLSLALENANLFQQTQTALEEVENRRQIADSLRQIANLVGASLQLEEVVERLLDQLPNLIPFNRATIQLVQDGGRQLLGGRGFDVAQSLMDPSNLLRPIKTDPLINEVFESQKPLLIPDTRLDPRWDALPATDMVFSWLAAPMVAAGEVVGFLLLDNQQVGAYTHETADLAMTFAAQAAVAIRNARLFKQVQESLAETDALYQASSELNSAQTYQDILRILHRSSPALRHQALTAVFVGLFDRPWLGSQKPDWMQKAAELRFGPPQNGSSDEILFEVDGAAAGLARLTGDRRVSLSLWDQAERYWLADRPSVVDDLPGSSLLDEAARDYFGRAGGGRTPLSLLSVPLNVGGQWIGVLCALYAQPAGLLKLAEAPTPLFAPKLLRSLEALASQAAAAIQNIRLYEETRRRATQLETAAEIARDTSGTLALGTLLSRAVNLIRDRYGYYHAAIYLVDDAGKNAVVRESTGAAGQAMKDAGYSFPVGSDSVIGQVCQTGETILIDEIDQDPLFRPHNLLPDTRAELAIALRTGSRHLGALDVHSAALDAFSPDDQAVLRVLADQLAVAVDNARSYERAQQAASETARRVQELSTIYAVTQAISNAELKSQEIGHIIAERFVGLLPVERVTVYTLESRLVETAETLQAAAEPKPVAYLHILEVLDGAAQPAADAGQVDDDLLLENYPLLLQVVQSARPMMRPGVTLAPLAVKGQTIGLVELQHARDTAASPDEAQLNLMMTIANAAAVALENARLYEQQIKTAEQLREVDKLKSQFLANMSHELRTPLNSIIGFSRVILKGIDGPINELQQQDLTAIHAAGGHLLQLITDVLDISKIEAGKMELVFDERVNLGDLAVSAMSTAVGLTKDKPIKLVKNIAPNLPVVRADPTRIRQVMINFLSNAAKFTDEGVITLTVFKHDPAKPQIGDLVSLPTDKEWVCVQVSDTGPGISRKDQTKLFLPFSQVDSSSTRKVGGTGLGLSISRLLIEMHEGRIGVESEVGKGAAFYFCLPALPPELELEAGDALDGESSVAE